MSGFTCEMLTCGAWVWLSAAGVHAASLTHRRRCWAESPVLFRWFGFWFRVRSCTLCQVAFIGRSCLRCSTHGLCADCPFPAASSTRGGWVGVARRRLHEALVEINTVFHPLCGTPHFWGDASEFCQHLIHIAFKACMGRLGDSVS